MTIGNMALGSCIGRHLETVKIDGVLCAADKADLRTKLAEITRRAQAALDAPEPPPEKRRCYD